MWTREQAQRRADELGFVNAQPERAIRSVAGRAAREWDRLTFIGKEIVIPWEVALWPNGDVADVREVRLVPPSSWGGDEFVLQLVFEEQIRDQLKKATS